MILYRTDENNFQLHIEMGITVRKITSILKQRGYKLTPQRRAVLNIITASQDHLTPTAIHERTRREYPGIGLVTVYRTLAILAALGLICEVHAGGSCRSYLMRRPLEHHHHLICSECGKVIDIADCDLDKLEQRLSRATGFKVEAHLLEFLGRCSDCQEEKA